MATFNSKRIVCLANSRKMGGRCVAGKEVLPDGRPGKWIRPVSPRENDGVSEDERQYEDGTEPRVLDVIDLLILQARPRDYQQENWLLDPDHYWERVGRFTAGELEQYTDPVGPLWVDGHSSSSGHNARVPFSSAVSLSSSLKLIRVGGLALSVSTNPSEFGDKRSLQGRFSYAGREYALRITDPAYEEMYLRRPDGSYGVGKRLLTVSLGGMFHGFGYKLIAAIIEP